ncbi:lipid kinase YegS [Limnobaculum zhutongyuii]|uniref:Probable lipid kinase YegS-like n=1 Tax=Limnobaculum zhutongyuii TaxID=2498113 RepID=A0A411WJW1_9GAMM|nr:lipid kinase YegS [Limnobaculum zhutongyuii]QBH96484.1 lipid kinase YegS [Limnobaculum zhutongyuii]TQS90486.1 lipid kinase YegS [Limnobaculum zhutongyuii]
MAISPNSFIILNGKGANTPEVRDAIKKLREQGYQLDVRVTWEYGDAGRYVAEAQRQHAELIIAGGGDGTINEVAAAIVQLSNHSRPALGILPLGTANDFATACQIPEQPYQALTLGLNSKPVSIDMVKVNQQHYFINMATGGFGTKITTETPDKLKAALGGFSYLLHGITQANTLKPDNCTIKADNFHWSGEALVIGIGNGKQAGGGHPLCPEAKINDGKLQLAILMADESLPALLTSLINGKNSEHIIEESLNSLTLTSSHEMILNLDGEPLKGNQFQIEVVPAAIRCHLPPNCPLLI